MTVAPATGHRSTSHSPPQDVVPHGTVELQAPVFQRRGENAVIFRRWWMVSIRSVRYEHVLLVSPFSSAQIATLLPHVHFVLHVQVLLESPCKTVMILGKITSQWPGGQKSQQ